MQEFDFGKVTEWLESDEEKSELLKFIDEIKAISNKKSTRTNPLLSKSSNSTDVLKNTTYDELLLFDEILAAEINKSAAKSSDNSMNDRPNRTAKIITKSNQEGQTLEWNSQRQESDNDDEQVLHPAEQEPTPKSFDPQHLIERIRRNSQRIHVTSNYELLSCKSQSFLQRLAVLGEILT